MAIHIDVFSELNRFKSNITLQEALHKKGNVKYKNSGCKLLESFLIE